MSNYSAAPCKSILDLIGLCDASELLLGHRKKRNMAIYRRSQEPAEMPTKRYTAGEVASVHGTYPQVCGAAAEATPTAQMMAWIMPNLSKRSETASKWSAPEVRRGWSRCLRNSRCGGLLLVLVDPGSRSSRSAGVNFHWKGRAVAL